MHFQGNKIVVLMVCHNMESQQQKNHVTFPCFYLLLHYVGSVFITHATHGAKKLPFYAYFMQNAYS